MDRANTLNGSSFSCRLRPDPEEDSEISIFDAKKYFNETGIEQKVVCNRVSPVKDDLCDARFSSASSVEIGYGRNYRSQSFHATPTASSEASWNSQTGLLTNPPGAVPVKLSNAADQEKKRVSMARWLFGRKCPCSGKKSVEVEGEISSEPKTPKLRLSLNQGSKTVLSLNSQKPNSKLEKPESEIISIPQTRHRRFSSDSNCQTERVSAPATTGFTFPILGQSGPAKFVLPNSVPARTDPPRDSIESLEVFRPSNQHRQVPPPPHLAERDGQIFTFPTSPKSRAMTAAMAMAVEDDMASDASSDLFEIESFSTQTTATTTYQITGPRRDSLDEAASFNARRLSGGGAFYCRRSLDEPPTPSVAPTECYEPSEASIDWSVTTAEGFDRGSVTSYSVAASEFEDVLFDRVGDGGGGGGKRRGKGLLSCRSEKAVSVGPQPVSEWVPPMVVGMKPGYVSGGRLAGGIGHKKPPLGSSGAARLSLAFAT